MPEVDGFCETWVKYRKYWIKYGTIIKWFITSALYDALTALANKQCGIGDDDES